MKNKKTFGWLSIILGLGISFATHFYMLYQIIQGQQPSMMLLHALLNLLGGVLIVTGIVMKK